MKITKRDVKFFILGILTAFLLAVLISVVEDLATGGKEVKRAWEDVNGPQVEEGE